MLRLSTNFAYMARSLPTREVNDFEDAGKAVVEHHFDNQECCGDWCNRKGLTKDERKESKK